MKLADSFTPPDRLMLQLRSQVMTKKGRLRIRVFLIVLGFVIFPIKYTILSIAGTKGSATIEQLSTECYLGKAQMAQPRVKASFFIAGTKQVVAGRGGYGNPDFCQLSIGDSVEVTYLQIPGIDFLLVTLGEAERMILEIIAGAIFINIVGNVILAFDKIDQKKRP